MGEDFLIDDVLRCRVLLRNRDLFSLKSTQRPAQSLNAFYSISLIIEPSATSAAVAVAAKYNKLNACDK